MVSAGITREDCAYGEPQRPSSPAGSVLALSPAYNEAVHIADVVAAADGHVHLAVGARGFRHMPPVRRVANALGEWIFSRAVGRTIRDNQSGCRWIGR